MPTKQRVWFDNHQRLSPSWETTREQDEESAVARSKYRTLSLTLQHDQLLAQKGVFHDQLGLTALDVCKHAADEVRFDRLEALLDGSLEHVENASERLVDG